MKHQLCSCDGLIIESRVGWPLPGYSWSKQEYKKGEQLDGFIVPFNFFDNIYGLFHRFNLWHSTAGICIFGPNHQPVQVQSEYLFTEEPILVGDSVSGSRVLSSYCQYLERLGLWSCRVSFGNPPEPAAQSQEFDLLHSYLEAQQSLAESLMHYIDTILHETGIDSEILIPIQEKTQRKIQQIIKSVKEKMWH